MDIIALAYAFIASTIFILSYIKVYQRYFYLRKYYILGVIFLLCAVYMQFLLVHIDSFPVGYIGLISFVSYPLSFVLIFKTSILKAFFLSLNAILKIYIAFVFFGALYAQIQGIQFDVGWLSDSYLYHLSQGHAYVLSIGSLFIVDHFLLKDKLAYFFKLIFLVGILLFFAPTLYLLYSNAKHHL